MVAVVQLVEHQVVILAVAGSSPVSHPAGGRVFSPSHLLHQPSPLHPYRNLEGLPWKVPPPWRKAGNHPYGRLATRPLVLRTSTLFRPRPGWLSRDVTT